MGRRGLRRFGYVFLLCLVFTILAGPEFTADEAIAQSSPPNIVLIVTDDQRWDTLWSMPTVQSELVQKGVTFDQAFNVNPLCCPSRASILAGQYSRNTGVYQNNQLHLFDDDFTMATVLQSAGYETALVGKYFVGYYNDALASYVPPGWSRWFALLGPEYYSYDVSDDGFLVSYGSTAADYVTDVLAGEAVEFINSAPAEAPLFLYFAPTAPHEPATPAPRHNNAFFRLPAYRPPSYNEADVSDKPAYIRALSTFGNSDKLRRKQHESLLAVDEAVEAILEALAATGRLENTLIVYTSDHGLLWKEHRWRGKAVPYEEAIRVPFIVRYDQLANVPRTDANLVLNIDLAPTFAEVAGVVASDMDGSSLEPLLGDPSTIWRDDFLIEHTLFQRVPTFCAVRNHVAIYVYYKTGETELYDLTIDPFQLVNRSSDPAYAEMKQAMHSRLRELCSPAPGGLVIPA